MSPMTTESEEACDAAGQRTAITPRWPGFVFAGTILLSAFLLFQVQPLISKFILPWFGGCPAVWTTCMLFFQVALFAGYGYAHLVGSRLTLRKQAVLQGLLVLAAVAPLPIAPAASWKPPDSTAPTWRILLLLLATVGLPYFVLSTTSPLVQVWFSRSYPGRSPYRLYALSNVGSLAALLSYPFVFEPAFDLLRETALWSWAFVAYGLLVAAAAVWLWRLSQRGQDRLSAIAGSAGAKDSSAPVSIGLWRRGLWLFLPACASVMLLATTNHVCQDVAVVPFLWVAPLALYLLSFIICFDHPRWYLRGLWTVLAALAILMAAGTGTILHWLAPLLGPDASLDYVQELVLYFSTLFFICMVCHGELARLRPDPRHLTEYYLLMSAGGALGGVLVSLVAPQVFKTFFEWNLGLILSYAVAAAALLWATARGLVRLSREPAVSARLRWAGLAAFLGAASVAAAAGMALLVQWQAVPDDKDVLERGRNFYGTVFVQRNDGRMQLRHGAITHGEQFTDAAHRRIPLTYYGYTGGIGRTLQYMQRGRPVMRVGLIGLGVGTLASYARQGDTYRFYEINPEVCRLAEEPRYFSYLADARGRGATIEMAMGDARLSLDREPAQRFDLLILDAFSGDSIPTHLLTREAFAIFRRHLAPGGVIAAHITNSYLRLAPVVRGIGEDAGLGMTRIYTPKQPAVDLLRNDWMVLTNDKALLAALPPAPPVDFNDDFSVPLWTDQHSNLFEILE